MALVSEYLVVIYFAWEQIPIIQYKYILENIYKDLFIDPPRYDSKYFCSFKT
jgi:hypothetical protein